MSCDNIIVLEEDMDRSQVESSLTLLTTVGSHQGLALITTVGPEPGVCVSVSDSQGGSLDIGEPMCKCEKLV